MWMCFACGTFNRERHGEGCPWTKLMEMEAACEQRAAEKRAMELECAINRITDPGGLEAMWRLPSREQP